MTSTLYTIGHSNRPLEEFIALLQYAGIQRLVDIRSLPGSRKYPHFDKENLMRVLPEQGIAYTHLLGLGGRRKVQKDSLNTGWRHDAFRGYADYMQSPEFESAVAELAQLAQAAPTAVMCSEAVPWRCHRSLVGDAMLVRGWEVRDIISRTSIKPHTLTPWARVEGTRITYPPEAEQQSLPLG